ncbi:MAG: DapH/DapD/GlmU-related protein [Ignavibacteriae bacterium]|nr:DapH/DapD/GlmU-related protein [Ignavibacteriota bacterium]
MILPYYKYAFKDCFKQFFRRLKLRRNNYIGKKCSISKDCVLEGGNVINDYVYILEKVKLKKNTTIGFRAVIANMEVGENSIIDCGVLCTGYGDGKIIIGDNTYIGINNILDWSNNITIGNFVHIAGPSTGIWTHSSVNMPLKNVELKNLISAERYRLPIKIEDNVYIGGNCTIYPGVTIKNHSIVAPNSVVNKDVEPYTMVGGVPAKFIKKVEI